MLSRLLLVFLVAVGNASAFAAEQFGDPYLVELMKQPSYRAAWAGMLAGQTIPPWVESYPTTLDGPPTPSIEIPVGGEAYTLAFTCKAYECADNQFYVLFSRSGAKAWGLLITGAQQKWLGAPDTAIQDAILIPRPADQNLCAHLAQSHGHDPPGLTTSLGRTSFVRHLESDPR